MIFGKWMPEAPPERKKVGLILVGGGARAAYQVGVLRAISELWPRDAGNPFPVICGTSAGAINGAVLAIHASRFHLGVRRLSRIWRNFHVEQVFRADAWGLFRSSTHWLTALLLGGLGRYNPQALLDRTPLVTLLHRYVRCEYIQDAIDAGDLHAFSVTASGYTSGQSVSFYQSIPETEPWQRARRVGRPAFISTEHLMASSAIPFVFASIKIDDEFFGDGSVGQMAPISPALHLGADRVLVIGVREEQQRIVPPHHDSDYPSLAQIAGYVLDSIFLDALDADLERLQRINKTISLIPSHSLKEGNVSLRHVDALVISPSIDIEETAARYMHELPRSFRLLLRGVGAVNERGSSLVSYLLFEKGYCRALIKLGYDDTMARKEEVLDFLRAEASSEVAAQPAL